jgi:hypothetical protein
MFFYQINFQFSDTRAQWFEMRGGCSLCWHCCNCRPSVFKLSLHEISGQCVLDQADVIIYFLSVPNALVFQVTSY